jgi:hypothetical protein
MTDLYDLGATPQDFEEVAKPKTPAKRCGLCRWFEPNFHSCGYDGGAYEVSQNECCELFEMERK